MRYRIHVETVLNGQSNVVQTQDKAITLEELKKIIDKIHATSEFYPKVEFIIDCHSTRDNDDTEKEGK